MKLQFKNGIKNTSTPPTGAVYAIGNFDGVHLGHRRLFDACREIAENGGATAVAAFTFDGIDKDGGRLISDGDRAHFLHECGADIVCCEDFSAIRRLSPEEFVTDYLIGHLSPSAIVCGENFRFGAAAKGDTALLGELLSREGVGFRTVKTVTFDGETVSTTRIKRALSSGDVVTAALLLGRKYSFEYRVERGKHLGGKLGTPTANQYFCADMFVPSFGVYASRATVDGMSFSGVTNIGIRPTFDDGEHISAETYLIGYTGGELYGKKMRLELLRFIRPEQKFDSEEALARQIKADIAKNVSE